MDHIHRVNAPGLLDSTRRVMGVVTPDANALWADKSTAGATARTSSNTMGAGGGNPRASCGRICAQLPRALGANVCT